MLILPSDHSIQKEAAFHHEAIQVGAKVVQQGKLVTFGILPTHTETGYSYIEAGSLISEGPW